jgi:hypothetical protein
MTKKFDGVIESVRYMADGKIDIVRAYERRGAAFSDYVLLTRDVLVDRLSKGKRFVVGARKIYLGGVFDVKGDVRYVASNDVVTTLAQTPAKDKLEAPVF